MSELASLVEMDWLATGVPVAVLISFAFTSLLIELTPGPNMTWLALVAAGEGRRFGFAAVLGVTTGLLAIGLAAALGLTAIFQTSDALYESLRWAGVVFLLYLAWEGWTAKSAPVSDQLDSGQGYLKFFLRGLVVNLLNPKAAVFYVTVLPTFLPDATNITAPYVLTLVYVGVATLVHVLIVGFAGFLEPFLNTPAHERKARKLLSGLLALVAIWFAIGTAR